jgi:glycosyltransferase involved in cell wall biosynthesis
MNVVHVFPYTPRVLGGHSNAIRGFIACQRAKGINAVGIAPKADAAAAETDWGFPFAEVDSLWELRWTIIAERFGISSDKSLVNLHGVSRRYAPLLGDLRRAGVPYVLTSHGQLDFHTPWRCLKKFVYLNLVNRDPGRAAGFQFLSRITVRRARFLLPSFRGAVLVQGNLVKPPNLVELPMGARSEYGLPQNAFVVLFLGRLDVPMKGLDKVVEAFSFLPADCARLLLVGPDWKDGKAELEKLAERLGCRERVHFTGPVYGEKKWALLRMADLFVSPSRWEAFSIAQAEAMMVGLPVVTSASVNLAQEWREADAALLTPLAMEPIAKALASLAADPERRRALGNRAKAWAEKNCDPDLAGPRFQEFYQAILDKAQGTRA